MMFYVILLVEELLVIFEAFVKELIFSVFYLVLTLLEIFVLHKEHMYFPKYPVFLSSPSFVLGMDFSLNSTIFFNRLL